MNNKTRFRFQTLEVWKLGADLSYELFRLADQLESRRLFRFAEQLRAATLSITNNIAEGSGSTSKIEFANFLNMARRSSFETANILFLLQKAGLFDESKVERMVGQLER